MTAPERKTTENSSPESEWRKAIEENRAQIDTIDTELFALLEKRLGFVKKIGEIKHKHAPDQFVIRPGREADMVRRVYEHFSGTDFNPLAATSMWRNIIAASTSVEAPLKISVFSPADYSPLYWMAREYFGTFSPVQRQPSARRVVGDILDGKANIGILPMLQQSETDQWWNALAFDSKDMPRIFAHIPFISSSSLAERDRWAGLAIARVEPEKTASDITFIVLKTDIEISQSRLNSLFIKHGFAATWISVLNPNPQQRHHLLELKGFHRINDAAFQNLLSEAGPSIIDSVVLGAYAEPILVPEPNHDKRSAN